MTRKQLVISLALAVLLVAIGVGAYFALSGGPATTIADAGKSAGFTISPSDKTLGNPKAKVTLIEYAAPTCPVCAAFNAENFGQLKSRYIDTGKIFYVFRVFPISSDDPAAEKIARCLPEDKYFGFIDLLFRNQPKWDHEYAQQNPALGTPQGVHDGLVLMGRIEGMSGADVDKCINNKADDDRINQVATDGQYRYGVSGTPTFVVNGTNVGAGNLPVATLGKYLDQALAGGKPAGQ